jgi:mycothiol synthase
MNAFSSAFGDVADADAENVRQDWEFPRFDPATDSVLVTDDAGRIVGYAWVWQTSDPALMEVDGFVHPAMNGRGIGTYLVRWAEARTGELTADMAPEAVVTLRRGHMANDASAARLVASEGYQIARHFWRMEIEMDEAPPAPQIPEGVQIRTFVLGQDDYATYEAVEESFADHWGHTPEPYEEWAESRIHDEWFDPSLCFLAVDGDQVAGITIGRPRGENGWVRTVGVKRPWRRRGLARALLLTAFHAFYARGIHVVGLGVDAQSPTGATRVYERAGMMVRTRYDLYEKAVPRAELATWHAQHAPASI